MASHSLNPVVDVIVQVSPLSAPRRSFDTGLIIGPSKVIPPEEDIRLYENTHAMLEGGFTTETPEYKAALLYFAQNPRPRKLMVGNRNVNAIESYGIGTAGAGYKVGDVVTAVSGTGTGATFRVTEIGTDGEVVALAILTSGKGYTSIDALATSVMPAGGTGLVIDVETVGLSNFLNAVIECRRSNAEWYAVSCIGASKQDIIDIAAYIETATPTSTQFYTTDDVTVPSNGPGNIFAVLKALKYSRSIGQYSTNPYAAVSIMAYAMRNNTGLANSTYTLKFKKEPGVLVEPLTATQLLNIKGNNGNVYINRGVYYDMFEEGVMADGTFFDEVLNLDMLSNDVQLNVMDKLYRLQKIPQTEAGVTQLVEACISACNKAVTRGFLAPGKWTGQEILNLKTGDYLIQGFLVQSESITDQTEADRESRKAPPIYVAIKEAGSVHSVVIGVYVSR